MKNSNGVLRKFVACMMALSILARGGILTPLQVHAEESSVCEIDWDELDANWQYEEGDGVITLEKYIGTGEKVVVYGKYVIEGVGYQTKLTQDCSNMFNGFDEDNEVSNSAYITSIIFDKGVDTSDVTDMSSMFKNLGELTELDVSVFNTSKVTNMANMFDGLNKLENLDLSNFDTSNVTSMDRMFQNNYALKSLNLSNFDTSAAVTSWNNGNKGSGGDGHYGSLTWMFEGCERLTELIVDPTKWKIPDNIIDESKMFDGDDTNNNHTKMPITKDELTLFGMLTAYYDAAAGKWVAPQYLGQIRPYGQCRDHGGEVLGVIVDKETEKMTFYWVKPATDDGKGYAKPNVHRVK